MPTELFLGSPSSVSYLASRGSFQCLHQQVWRNSLYVFQSKAFLLSSYFKINLRDPSLPSQALTSGQAHFYLFTFLFPLYISHFYSLSTLHSLLSFKINLPRRSGDPKLGRPSPGNFSLLPTEGDAVRSAAAGSPAPTSPYPIAPVYCTERIAYSPQPHQHP